jgi:DNA-binding transcriptional LysR family regulator
MISFASRNGPAATAKLPSRACRVRGKDAFLTSRNLRYCLEFDKLAIMQEFLASKLRIRMLDDLNELKTFRAILAEGSLSAAARRMGVTLAVVSKRLTTLEKRAGVQLVHRTTRSLNPTEEGRRLLTDIEHALDATQAGEERLTRGRDEPIGTLRVSATIAFGRRCVAPVVGRLATRYPRLAVSLELDDRITDVVGEGFDVAIRIGALADSSSMMRKLADNRRILVAAPAYLDRAGRPATPAEAARHEFLRYGERFWPLASQRSRKVRQPVLPRPLGCASMMATSCMTGLSLASVSC